MPNDGGFDNPRSRPRTDAAEESTGTEFVNPCELSPTQPAEQMRIMPVKLYYPTPEPADEYITSLGVEPLISRKRFCSQE